jgi:hypothetical protein
MTQMDRRAFLAGLAATPALGLAAAASTPPIHGFLAESGKRGAWPMVIGLLRTSAPDLHEMQVGLLRRLHNYPRALRYMSTDRNKAAFAAALIDFATAPNDLRFTALVVDDPAGRWAELGEGKGAAYANLYRRLVGAAANEHMVVRLRRRDSDRRDAAIRAYLTYELRLETSPTGKSNLGELAAFLAGCIYGEATGVANPIKRALTERLRQKIGDPTKFAVSSVTI